MKRAVAALVFALLALTVLPAGAEDKLADGTDLQALRTAVQTDKRAYVASMLNLTAAEGKRFWPAYEAYQRSVDMTDRQRVVAVEALLAADRPISELYARNLMRELIVADEAEIKARRILHNRVTRALPSKKAARYLQIETKIRAVTAYDLASVVPLLH
jgi:hypothetical protein